MVAGVGEVEAAAEEAVEGALGDEGVQVGGSIDRRATVVAGAVAELRRGGSNDPWDEAGDLGWVVATLETAVEYGAGVLAWAVVVGDLVCGRADPQHRAAQAVPRADPGLESRSRRWGLARHPDVCRARRVPSDRAPRVTAFRRDRALSQLVAAACQVGRLGGVARQRDGSVVRRPRLLAAAQPAQDVGSGREVGVIVDQLVLETVDDRQRYVRAIELRDRNSSVQGDDRRRVEMNELVARATTCDQSVSRASRAAVCTALIAARI